MEAMHFVGILSPYPSQNPDFFNWNKVKVRYCDGASLAGNVESEDQSGLKLYFRGQRIWEAIIDQLLSEGLVKAKQAFLTGCSAGGLATFIHCDNFRSRLPKDTMVKCLADAGFFLDEKDISGKETIRSFFNEVVHLQGVTKSLPNDCVTAMKPPQCFFPHELIKRINTPLFILNPAYDFWQIQHILVPPESDPGGHWRRCRLNIRYCNSNQIEILQDFRKSLLDSLSKFQRHSKGGIFINSCFVHCQTMSNITWHSSASPRISNKTIAEAVGDWYFERRQVKEIDCPYPCNPTCFNMEFI
ncbi:pectin acetylesterase 5-like isoform X2 [Phalaenopsis equestris]|nr:pectin acetylesterase 5-like isoform X2 [Phalaenopsis equestris]